jgi:hypothetical protein
MDELKIGKPDDLNDDEKAELIEFVKAAGEVPGITLEHVKQAVCVVRLRSADALIGAAALKTPYDTYRTDRFAKAGLAGAERHYPLELGYLAVQTDLRQRRGLGHLLVAAALSRREKTTGVFATSEISNFGMHSILASRHFERAGADWEAPRKNTPDRRLALFLSPGVGAPKLEKISA